MKRFTLRTVAAGLLDAARFKQMVEVVIAVGASQGLNLP
jgi:hypothetical protein